MCLALSGAVSAQTADMYVSPGARMFFARGNEAAVFGNMHVAGNMGQETGSKLHFYGQSWVNDADAVFRDETSTGLTPGSGGEIYFRQPHPLYGNLGLQTLEGGYNTLDYSGPMLPSLFLENNSGLVLMNGNASVRNRLHLDQGHIYVNGNDLAVGQHTAPGRITGYDENHFVVTGGGQTGGSLAMMTLFPEGDTVVFPIGTDEGAYTPAAVRNTANKTANFKARVFDGVYDAGLSGDDISVVGVKKTWQVVSSGEVFHADVFLQHSLSDEGPLFYAGRHESFISRLVDNKWDTADVMNAPRNPGWMTTGNYLPDAGINDRSFTLQTGGMQLFTKMTRPVPYECVAQFTYFTIWKEGTFRTKLNWGVLARPGIVAYEVEKRIGRTGAWNVVTRIQAVNEFDYSWVDEDIHYDEQCYYRIRLICFTGEHVYSDMRVALPEDIAIVYPNPTEGKFTLSVAFPDRVSAAVLHDAAGKKVLTRKITQQLTEFDISYVAAGVYFISVYSDKNVRLAVVKMLKVN